MLRGFGKTTGARVREARDGAIVLSQLTQTSASVQPRESSKSSPMQGFVALDLRILVRARIR